MWQQFEVARFLCVASAAHFLFQKGKTKMADITTIGKRELSSAQIGDYVHKAAEIERDIYALQEMEKRFREETLNLIKKARMWNEKAKEERKYNPPPCTPKTYEKPGLISSVIGSLIVFIVPTFVIAVVGYILLVIVLGLINEDCLNYIMNEKFGWVVLVLFSIGPILGMITGVVAYRDEKKKYQHFMFNKDRIYKMECEEVEKEKALHIKNAEEYETQAIIFDQKATIMTRQTSIVREQREKLEKLRSEFYSVGIIPPDYREMDCVYVFDQIFRNDLAYNMRQAVSIYEERVFRGEIIRGMGAIIQQLGSIKGQLAGLARDIYSIKTNVDFMSQDFYKLVDGQKAHQNTVDSILRESKAQTEKYDEILENSKATRYAAEAVQRSVEYNNKYKNI